MSNFSSSLRVRSVVESDVGAITRIYADYVRTHLSTFDVDPPDENEMAARMRSTLVAGLPYRVAEHAGEVIGYCYAAPYRPRAAYRHTLETSIYVARTHVGLGTGSQLLRGVIEACRESKYRELIAAIGDSANQASIRLHRSAGFRHVGTLADVGFKFERWVDVVIMQLSLREDALSGQRQGDSA